MKPNMIFLTIQAVGKTRMQVHQIVATLLLLFVASFSKAQINPQFSPGHNVELCGEGEVYFVCQVPKVPDYIKWDFGDGATAVSVNPSHRYTQPGKYTVKMYVEKGGMKDSIIKEDFVYVKLSPVARFTMEQTVTFLKERTFVNNSISNADSMISYAWNIGDTNTYMDKDFQMMFPAPGKYTVSLFVMNNLQCTDEYRMDIHVSEPETDSPMNTAVAEITEKDLFELYPNPANENVFIRLKNSASDADVRIMNLSGKEFYHATVQTNGDMIKLDVQDLQPGMYIVTLNVNHKESRIKFLRS